MRFSNQQISYCEFLSVLMALAMFQPKLADASCTTTGSVTTCEDAIAPGATVSQGQGPLLNVDRMSINGEFQVFGYSESGSVKLRSGMSVAQFLGATKTARAPVKKLADDKYKIPGAKPVSIFEFQNDRLAFESQEQPPAEASTEGTPSPDAVSRIHDLSPLISRCRRHVDYSACEVIASLAQHDPDARMRYLLARRVEDKEVLAKIALTDTDARVRKAALLSLRDPALLAKVAATDPDASVRQLAADLQARPRPADREPDSRPGPPPVQASQPAPAQCHDSPAEIASLPTEASAYRSSFFIPRMVEVSDRPSTSSTDAMIQEIDAQRGVVMFSGDTEILLDGRSNNWAPGARHTICGVLHARDYLIASDPSAPLVFRIDATGAYVYQSGRGVVVTPDKTAVYLGAPK